jgi:hypothetical protein
MEKTAIKVAMQTGKTVVMATEYGAAMAAPVVTAAAVPEPASAPVAPMEVAVLVRLILLSLIGLKQTVKEVRMAVRVVLLFRWVFSW